MPLMTERRGTCRFPKVPARGRALSRAARRREEARIPSQVFGETVHAGQGGLGDTIFPSADRLRSQRPETLLPEIFHPAEQGGVFGLKGATPYCHAILPNTSGRRTSPRGIKLMPSVSGTVSPAGCMAMVRSTV